MKYTVKWWFAFLLIIYAGQAEDNPASIFPGHIYEGDEEGGLDSKEDYKNHIKNHKDLYEFTTPERPAGDCLFVDGDTGEVDWNDIARKIIDEFEGNDAHIKYEEYSTAKNVILFVGSGMGPSTVSAARIYSMQDDQTRISFDSFPALGISKTYATNAIVTDGAASATALSCGEKNKRGVVGLSQNVERGDCNGTKENKLESLLKKASAAGKWTGIVTTGSLTHPASASSFANAADRNWETDTDRDADLNEYEDRQQCPDIASQLVDEDVNKNIKVLLGGGRRSFTPNTEADPEYPDLNGRRSDGRNLVNEWIQQKEDQEKTKYVWNKAEFDDVDPDETDHLLGLFEPSSMRYELDKEDDPSGEPNLSQMVEKALAILNRAPEGFFLLVVGGKINEAHQENKAIKALAETSHLSKAVRVAQEMTSGEETLIAVTADHSTVMTFAGYPVINNPIGGLTRITSGLLIPMLDLKPYTTLMYSNGPGFLNHRTDLNSSDPVESIQVDDVKARKDLRDSEIEVGTKDYFYDAAMYRKTGSDGGEDVAVYGTGPMSRMFTGSYEQNYISHAIMYASCIGEYADRLGCDKNIKEL